MRKIDSNVCHDFVFALLHGRWAHAVRGPTLHRLLNSGTVEALQQALRSVGLNGTNREIFHRELRTRELSRLAEVAGLLGGGAARYYRSLIAGAHYENLKTLLHCRFLPEERQTNPENMLLQAEGVPVLNHQVILRQPDTPAFLEAIPGLPGLDKGRLSEIVGRFEQDHDIMLLECSLDRMYAAHTFSAAKSAPLDFSRHALELNGTRMDILNLDMLLRNVQTYHFDVSRMAEVWLPGGRRLSIDFLDSQVDKDIGAVLAALPEPYRSVLQPFAEQPLCHGENALWSLLYREASRLFMDLDDPPSTIPAYPVLLHFESLNISRVYEGVHFGLPSRELEEMMIGA